MVRVAEIGLLVVPTVWLPKLSVAGDRLAATTPLPLVLTVCGLLLALSVIVTAPVADPNVVGLNVTEIVHFLPANTVLPQVLVSANGPVTAMLVIVSGAVPVLVRITFLTALLVPTTTLPKFRLVAESVTDCAVAAGTSDKNARQGSKSTVRNLPGKPRLIARLTKRAAKTNRSLHQINSPENTTDRP